MSDSAYAAPAPEFDDYGDDGFDDERLPGRPRRQFLNRWSAGALALLVGAAGFYIGVRVEKSKFTGGSSSSGLASALASRFGASGASGASGTAGSRAATGGFPGGLAQSNASVGTVSSVNGNAIYVKQSDGNTVQVKITSATTITKRETVSKGKVNPGDTVVIQTAKGAGGKLTATSITDSGASSSSSGSATNSGSTGSTGSTATGGGSSVIKSLFGGG